MLCICSGEREREREKKFSCFFFQPHPCICCKRAKLSTLNSLSNSFSLEIYGFEEWSWYVICLVYYKSEFSQYFCFVLFVSWELCNQSRCLKQSRKCPLWIRENLVHSIFSVCVFGGWAGVGGHNNKANILFSVYCAQASRRLEGGTSAAPALLKLISYRLAPFKWGLITDDKPATPRWLMWRGPNGSAKVRKHKGTRARREISYTLLMSAPAPKLLFLITFPCDIICCKIVYAWGTFRSCQLKSIWTNQYLSILWHTHSWPLGKSCLK